MGAWLKTLGEGAWSIVTSVIGLAVFVAFAIPLGQYVWDWVSDGNHALVLIAAAVVAGAASHIHTNTPS